MLMNLKTERLVHNLVFATFLVPYPNFFLAFFANLNAFEFFEQPFNKILKSTADAFPPEIELPNLA